MKIGGKLYDLMVNHVEMWGSYLYCLTIDTTTVQLFMSVELRPEVVTLAKTKYVCISMELYIYIYA